MQNKMNRKDFVKVAGVGSAAAAAAVGVPLAANLGARENGTTLSFRAAAALPEPPRPGYATHLIEGTVDLRSGTGIATTRVLAGHPGDTGIVGLPGLSRIIRITDASEEAGRYTLAGVIDDRSHLRKGEAASVKIVIDRDSRTIHAPFLGRQLAHAVAA
jgi:hypothetical protein